MMEFTSKRRLLAAIQGKETDFIPFSPFLAYYFDFLPKEIQQKGQLEYLKAMGADPLLRGHVTAFQIHPNACSTVEKKDGNHRYRTVYTPKGELHSVYTYVAQSNTWFLTEHPVKSIDDFPAAIAYFRDLVVEDNIQNLNQQIELLGEDGLYIALVGAFSKSSYQYLLEHVIGTENLIYLTMDYPDAIKELVDALSEKNRQTIQFTAESKIEACLSWEDSSTTNLSPSLYEEYIAPEIQSWCTLLKQSNKMYIQHACGHVKDLLLPMANQGITAVESLSPPPTGNVTIEQAAKLLPPQVGIIGGIEPVQFLNDSVEQLLDYVEMLCHIMKGRGFVLANSDSCPPGVKYEKFQAIAQYLKHN
ncbi:MAG: uroporphyrinogen decarboxylase family protein [Candidatus Merdivicinus sp.]|jgi:hypothetical protein